MERPSIHRTRRGLFSYAFSICIALIPVLLLTLSGCGKKEVVKDAYFENLNRWTRGVKVYEGLETRLYANATYKHPSLRDAYIERYTKDYQLEEGYIRAFKEREAEQAEQYNEFFFTAYTPDEKWNDFHKRDSIWKIYLEDNEGARLTPISIVKIDSSDPLIREFFPYFDLWSSGYIIKFPKYSDTGVEPVPGPHTKSMRLVITGVFGKGELEWKMSE